MMMGNETVKKVYPKSRPGHKSLLFVSFIYPHSSLFFTMPLLELILLGDSSLEKQLCYNPTKMASSHLLQL